MQFLWLSAVLSVSLAADPISWKSSSSGSAISTESASGGVTLSAAGGSPESASFLYTKLSKTESSLVDVYIGNDDLPKKERAFGPIQKEFTMVQQTCFLLSNTGSCYWINATEQFKLSNGTLVTSSKYYLTFYAPGIYSIKSGLFGIVVPTTTVTSPSSPPTLPSNTQSGNKTSEGATTGTSKKSSATGLQWNLGIWALTFGMILIFNFILQ